MVISALRPSSYSTINAMSLSSFCGIELLAPSPTRVGIRALFFSPQEKLLKQRFFFLLAQRRPGPRGSPRFPRRKALIAGTIDAADLAGGLGPTLSLGCLCLLRFRIGRGGRTRACRLFRSAAGRGSRRCLWSRDLSSLAVPAACHRRRIRRGIVGAGPFEPFGAILREGVCDHHCAGDRQSGNQYPRSCHRVLPTCRVSGSITAYDEDGAFWRPRRGFIGAAARTNARSAKRVPHSRLVSTGRRQRLPTSLLP